MRLHATARFIFAALLTSTANPTAGPSSPPVPPVAVDCSTSRPIDEQGFVRIGGIEQWITIRGERCANPVILFLHGGPGNPNSPYAEAIYAAWEKEFTLVQWDQRGSAKTFGRNAPPASLTIEQMTRDGLEVAAYLGERLGQKIILLGGSWSSVLGVHMAKARPDLFHVYLGVGQLVKYQDNQAASYQQTMRLAEQAGDSKSVAALVALGPPPWVNPRAFGALRRVTRTYEAKTAIPAPAHWWDRSAAYATPAALAEYEGGEEFSYLQFVGLAGDGMLSKVDLPALGSDFQIPIFLVQGEADLVTVPDIALSYFNSISAPQKQYRSVATAGHDPNAALVDAQLDLLRTRIRPLIQ